MNEIWNDKKKRTILIASICAVLLLIVIAAVMLGGNSDAGKEVYELFPWGTSKEKVFQKLDQRKIDYRVDDVGNVIVEFNTIQGVPVFSAKAVFCFENTDSLKNIWVGIESADSMYERIAKQIEEKYGEAADGVRDSICAGYTTDGWKITLDTCFYTDYEVGRYEDYYGYNYQMCFELSK